MEKPPPRDGSTAQFSGPPGEPREVPPGLVKMSELAKASGVPAPTIKHYIAEGLLPQPTLRTSRNMAYYRVDLVPRIRAIKALQRDQFLPLKVIRQLLEGGKDDLGEEGSPEWAISKTLQSMASKERRTRKALLESGLAQSDLMHLEGLGVVWEHGSPEGPAFYGDDLELLRTLGAARRAGITEEMLPISALDPYALAIRALVKIEVDLMREGILPRAGANLERVLDAATRLSERLVVLLRRKLILPVVNQMVTSASVATLPKAKPRRRTRSPVLAAKRTAR